MYLTVESDLFTKYDSFQIQIEYIFQFNSPHPSQRFLSPFYGTPRELEANIGGPLALNRKIKEWGDQVSHIVTEKSIVIESREPAITFAAPTMRLSIINVSNLR